MSTENKFALTLEININTQQSLPLTISLSWFFPAITMTSHEFHAVSDHRWIDCLLNNLRGPTSKSALLALCEGNSPVVGEFLAQKASTRTKGGKSLHFMTSSWRLCKADRNHVAISVVTRKCTALLALWEGNPSVTVGFPSQTPSDMEL